MQSIVICEYTLGDKEMDNSLLFKSDQITQYDSLVNDMDNPTIFVINRDYHAFSVYIMLFNYKQPLEEAGDILNNI